jgi:hypothetical protein
VPTLELAEPDPEVEPEPEAPAPPMGIRPERRPPKALVMLPSPVKALNREEMAPVIPPLPPQEKMLVIWLRRLWNAPERSPLPWKVDEKLPRRDAMGLESSPLPLKPAMREAAPCAMDLPFRPPMTEPMSPPRPEPSRLDRSEERGLASSPEPSKPFWRAENASEGPPSVWRPLRMVEREDERPPLPWKPARREEIISEGCWPCRPLRREPMAPVSSLLACAEPEPETEPVAEPEPEAEPEAPPEREESPEPDTDEVPEACPAALAVAVGAATEALSLPPK